MASTAELEEVSSTFRRLTGREDGSAVVTLLEQSQLAALDAHSEDVIQHIALVKGGETYGEVLSLYLLSLRGREMGEQVRELELACTCLKTWVQRYIEVDGGVVHPGEQCGTWMTPMMLHLSVMARRVATQLDQAKRSEANSDMFLKKLVEIHRELFQRLNRDKTKRAGLIWVCCELLRAYFKLGQISQCSFLLSAVQQSLNKDGFNPTDLPKAISATFYFYWGKFCVFDQNLRDADLHLSWALKHCPPRAGSNRRKILLYLVPCKLRLGVLPTKALLHEHGLTMFADIVQAIRDGNLKLFTEKMEEHAADFIKMGTYVLMMKLKFTVLRQLTKNVHRELRRSLGDNAAHKLDLAPFEHIFNWQDEYDMDETACVLSNLVYQGAVKGYMAHEHRKIVFAKEQPFPPPSKWRM